MRRISPLCLVVLLLALACSACMQTRAGPVNRATVTLQGHQFSVELATTPDEQARGLMERTFMAKDHGMLFVFTDDMPRTFWMKDTLIPLDMLFFDSQRRLVAIRADAQPCTTDPCMLYSSVVPARYVLELNAGMAARIGAHKGDVISIAGLSSSRTQ